jgi:hypothetical protein
MDRSPTTQPYKTNFKQTIIIYLLMLNAYSVGEKSQGWTPDKFFSYKPDHKYNQVPQYTGHKT